MYTFLKTRDPKNEHDAGNVRVEIDDPDADLDTLLTQFRYFLMGCGFSPDLVKRIDLVDEEEETVA